MREGTLREKLFGAGRARLTRTHPASAVSREATGCGGGVTRRVGKGALARRAHHPYRVREWWARFALLTLHSAR